MKTVDKTPVKRFANVWDAIEEDPAMSEEMKQRSRLLMELSESIKLSGSTDEQLIASGVFTTSLLDDIRKGKVDKFNQTQLEALNNYFT